MAKKIFLKIWSVLIYSLTLLGADIGPQANVAHAVNTPMLWQLPVRRSSKPELFLQQSSAQESNVLVAGHRSHASHASHRSHASHVSGASTRTPSSESPSSPTDTEGKRTPSPTKPETPTSSAKKVFMRNGAILSCDSVWISEGKVYFAKDGKTFSLPLEEVDIVKTPIGGEK